MLRVALEELVKEVLITLDENASQSAYLKENRDKLELDEIIISKLLKLPVTLLNHALLKAAIRLKWTCL